MLTFLSIYTSLSRAKFFETAIVDVVLRLESKCLIFGTQLISQLSLLYTSLISTIYIYFIMLKVIQGDSEIVKKYI